MVWGTLIFPQVPHHQMIFSSKGFRSEFLSPRLHHVMHFLPLNLKRRQGKGPKRQRFLCRTQKVWGKVWSDSVKRHLSRRHLSVLIFCSISFSMVGAPAKKKSAFAKAASIPAKRQSENAGPRLFGFIFRCCPPSRIFFQFLELSTKAAFAKAAFDTLRDGNHSKIQGVSCSFVAREVGVVLLPHLRGG